MDGRRVRGYFDVLWSCFGVPIFGAILGLTIGALCTLSLSSTLQSVYSATQLFVIYGGSLSSVGFLIGFLQRQSYLISITLGLAFSCISTAAIGLTMNPWSFIGVMFNGCVGLFGSALISLILKVYIGQKKNIGSGDMDEVVR